MSKRNPEVNRLLYSRNEAAQMLGICRATLDNLLHKGALPFTEVGSRRMVRAEVLFDFAVNGHKGRIRK